MKVDRNYAGAVYTVCVFTALASLDNAVIGLFPPLFPSIARDFDVHISALAIVSAANILITSFSSVIWGYLADRGNRKLLIIIGTVIWSVSVFLTAYSKNYLQLAGYQLITGIGLGCISSIGFSVLTDYVPRKWRGMLMSFWGMSQGFGGIAGSVMASVVAGTTNWRTPFKILAYLGVSFTILYVFIKEPKKGASEPELNELASKGVEYNYSIEYSHLKDIFFRKSNLWLILQGFSMSITTGSLIWLPTLFISKIEYLGYTTGTATIAAGYLYAILQVGGLSSVYFGYIGDKLQKRTYRGRSLLSAAMLLATMPLYTIMFITPMKSLILPADGTPTSILAALLIEIFANPWMLAVFLLSVGATAAQSANAPNWLAIIADVNLPEHRATVFSVGNLVNGFGKSIGNVLMGLALKLISSYCAEPLNYILAMVLFQTFLLPSALCYLKISKNSGRDIRHVKITLKKRTKLV